MPLSRVEEERIRNLLQDGDEPTLFIWMLNPRTGQLVRRDEYQYLLVHEIEKRLKTESITMEPDFASAGTGGR